MKISAQGYAGLKQEFIRAELTKNQVLEHKQKLLDDPRVKDINLRLRWDCFYHVTRNLRDRNEDLYKELYGLNGVRGLNSDHIDTALRNIFKELYQL